MKTREDILSLAVPVTIWMKSRMADELNKLGIREGSYDLGHDILTRVLAPAPTPPAAEAPGHVNWRAVIAELREEDDAEAPVSEERKAGWHACVDRLEEGLAALAAEAPGQEPVAYMGRGLLEHLNKPGVEYLNCCAYTKAGIWMLDEDQRVPVYAAPPTYADAEAKGFERGIETAAKVLEDRAEETRHDLDWLTPIGAAESPKAYRLRAVIDGYTGAIAAIRSLASPAPKGEM